MKHKRSNPTCDPWDSQGNEKNAISISTAFSINISIRNENIVSEEHTKNPFEMILYVGQVTGLRSWQGSQKLNIHL